MADNTKTEKPVHTIILDAGPIIKNEPSVSSLLQQCEEIVTTQAVISEIRDDSTRIRLQTTLLPFLKIRNPKPESVKLIADFAKKTGDYAVLSNTDMQLLALTYDVECERNEGDWRLRKTPGQKRTNGPNPKMAESKEQGNQETVAEPESTTETHESGESVADNVSASEQPSIEETVVITAQEEDAQNTTDSTNNAKTSNLSNQIENLNISQEDPTSEAEEDSDSEGWITPSNIRKHELADSQASTSSDPAPTKLQVALITTDFAMQNVLLQMNLNLLSTSLKRIRNIKSFILRCHGCFFQVRDLSKQFCPRCGQPTLNRVSCSTDQQTGQFKIHLKKNMQWNNRGNRYSVPKPVPGAANYKIKGGGKGSWGNDLIFSEDQKEYVRAVKDEKRRKERDLMDPDYLPGILGGDRSGAKGRPKIGAGRSVNSRKR